MYDFDEIVDRRHSNSLKWDIKENELPMWVADMDFKTAPAVIEALNKRVENGIFGYTITPDEWKDAIVGWWKKRHDIIFRKNRIIFSTGVVPTITCAVKRLTNVGDNVLVLTPVYDIFFHSIENHGRHVLESKLKYNGEKYDLDLGDLERKLANPQTTMMILCNPHNPVGKVWTREELLIIGELCEKYHVIVISDEIHCDLTDPGINYMPFASVSDNCKNNSVTCVSSSKAFNMAGLQGSAVIIPSERIYNVMERGLNSDEVAEPNAFVTDAMIGAFTQGEEWLEELRNYLYENKQTVKEYLKDEIPELKLISSDATYLLWIDCSKVSEDAEELASFIRRETGLYLADGSKYRGNGNHFLRMNIACPCEVVEEGLERLKRGIYSYEKWRIEKG